MCTTNPAAVILLYAFSNSTERRQEFRHKRGVFSLLASHPTTRPAPKKKAKKGDDPEWVTVQKKTFMGWANSHLQRRGQQPMTNLEEDMKDGLALISLLESLTNKEIGMK